ncbi:leucine-rich repeat and death domain-containing protein 1-like [Adelges cooleyi]|uniref:leucine-rich repeat and death domain-containing protein 1-like n=1 Tax=Adelges cooleyi TaxID=133065 RepID=UPI0021804654|nr:leucine-rich repeat and death domain-containing protein 1-like [Adelges cooleyi]
MATSDIGNIFHWNDRNLDKFPEDLKLYKNKIIQLYIKNNTIETLPRWINCMNKLSHIYLDNNKLSSFPDEFCQLTNLEVLCAPYNMITSIPSKLSDLLRLTQLDLSHNYIKIVPPEIMNMRSLWLLNLSHNAIETLPEINNPEELYFGEILLDNNKLICVPDNLARLKNIEYLSLNHNKLLYVPAVVFRNEAKIKLDHNPFLNYMVININANYCGTEKFLEAQLLSNVILICAGRNLVVSPKIKNVINSQNYAYYPSLCEFALRSLYVWKTPFSKNDTPNSLYIQLKSGPAATCMQCLRPMFTYSYICLIFNEAKTHLNAQYFCSKACHSISNQLFEKRYKIILQELHFSIKPFGNVSNL